MLLLSHKKEYNNALCSSNVDGSRDYHTKWSKSDKDKYHVYVKSSKKKTKTHRSWSQMWGYQRVNMWGSNKLGHWDKYIHTMIYKIDNQQGPTV